LADREFKLSGAGAGSVPGRSAGRRSRDLDYGKLHFERLPETRAEGEAVAALLGAQALFGPDAVEANMKKLRPPGWPACHALKTRCSDPDWHRT
jgi:hypothetical protein